MMLLIHDAIMLRLTDMLHSLLQLLEIWSCHILLVDRMPFASLDTNEAGIEFFEAMSFFFSLSLSLSLSPSLSGRIFDITVILLTRTFSLTCNSIKIEISV